MSIELLHTNSDVNQIDDWLAQSVAASEVPAIVEDPEAIGRVALLLTRSSPDSVVDRSAAEAA